MNQGKRPKELIILGQSNGLSKGTDGEECGNFCRLQWRAVFLEINAGKVSDIGLNHKVEASS